MYQRNQSDQLGNAGMGRDEGGRGGQLPKPAWQKKTHDLFGSFIARFTQAVN
jgi:hypothetical protein